MTESELGFSQVFIGSRFTFTFDKSRLEGQHNNNKMERLNGEIRGREKVTRNLKKPDSPILTGLQIYHNYVRPHMGLEGKTPSEQVGIEVKGKDKWLTLIQNASRKPTTSKP